MSEDKNEKLQGLIDDISAFSDDNYDSCLASSLYDKHKKDKELKKEEKEESEVDDGFHFKMYGEDSESTSDWIAAVASIPKIKPKRKLKSLFYDDDDDFSGGKKKKKKKKDGITDYEKKFDPEMRALKALAIRQNDFTDKLEQSYNASTTQKSQARGIGKFTNDLISNLNTARSTSLSITKEIIALKKTISDLTIKEKKELGGALDEDGNVTGYASNILKQLMSGDRKSFIGDSDVSVEDADEFSMLPELHESMINSDGYVERPDESNQYLKYEGSNIKVKVNLHPDDTYEFFAVDGDDNIIPDYPLPNPDTTLSINRSTQRARDEYGVSYEIVES